MNALDAVKRANEISLFGVESTTLDEVNKAIESIKKEIDIMEAEELAMEDSSAYWIETGRCLKLLALSISLYTLEVVREQLKGGKDVL